MQRNIAAGAFMGHTVCFGSRMERRKFGANDCHADQSDTLHEGTEGLQHFRLALATVERRLNTPTEEIAQPVACVDAGGCRFRLKPDRRGTLTRGLALSRTTRPS